MAAEYTYKVNASEVEEPLLLETTSSITIMITNTGDETATSLGFYLRSASSDGPFEFPSTDSPAVNLVDILKQGDQDEGIVLTQGLNSTRFKNGVGDGYETRIPLVIGSGTDGDELAPSEFIEITLDLSFLISTSSKNFYIDLVLG